MLRPASFTDESTGPWVGRAFPELPPGVLSPGPAFSMVCEETPGAFTAKLTARARCEETLDLLKHMAQ